MASGATLSQSLSALSDGEQTPLLLAYLRYNQLAHGVHEPTDSLAPVVCGSPRSEPASPYYKGAFTAADAGHFLYSLVEGPLHLFLQHRVVRSSGAG